MDDLRKVEINPTNLSEELAKQASNYLFVAERAVDAESAYEEGKHTIAQFEAQLDGQIRAQAVVDGKKTTETAIQSAIILTPDYAKMKLNLIRLGTIRDRLSAIKSAWRMRQDLIIEMARMQRQEIDGLLRDRVMEKKAT